MQNTLKDTEDKISYARSFYNDSAMKYNTKIESFPTNILANIFGLKPMLTLRYQLKKKKT